MKNIAFDRHEEGEVVIHLGDFHFHTGLPMTVPPAGIISGAIQEMQKKNKPLHPKPAPIDDLRQSLMG